MTVFETRHLLDTLQEFPIPAKYWVGFSGGADSTALLQALHESRDRVGVPIHAIHFHHGLQQDADEWQQHCSAFCQERDIPLLSLRLEISRDGRRSLEEASRHARYRAVAEVIGERDMYLTAHQAEDQAETLFLNLMRGSGIEGLAGIPALRSLERGWVARPLLERQRAELEQFLQQRGIEWLTDPSNRDTAFDRNFVRHTVFPLLDQRWPGLLQRLARSARHARITANTMAAFIERQCGELIRDELKMPLPQLLELEPEMRGLIVRQWLRRHEIPMLPEARLKEFLQQLESASGAGSAEVRWDDWMMRCYRRQLWLHRRDPFPPLQPFAWNAGATVELGPGLGAIHLEGGPLDPPGGWTIRARRRGDRIRPQADGPSRKLKQFFQDAAIPPWLRVFVPVLDWDGEAVALGDWVIGQRLRTWLRENGLTYHWEPTHAVLIRVRNESQNG